MVTKRIWEDGLNSIKYKIRTFEMRQLYTYILVDIKRLPNRIKIDPKRLAFLKKKHRREYEKFRGHP